MATSGKEESVAQRIARLTDAAEEPERSVIPISGYAKMPLVPIEQAVEPLVHILSDVQTHAYKAKLRCKKPADNLTPDESAAIMLYTMEWAPRDKCLYVALNNTLRSSSPDREEKLKPWYLYLRLFLNALFRLPPLRISVFRGIKIDSTKEYDKGKTVIWWGFSSSTTAIEVLQAEAFLGKKAVRTIFSIECQTARDICKHSFFPAENEVLLLAATQFQVTGCLDQGDLRIIQMKETRPSTPILQPVPIIGSKPSDPVWPEAEPPAGTKKEMTPAPTLANLSEPVYRNVELETLINRGKAGSELNLQRRKLTDQDMEIVAFRAVYTNTTLITLNLWNNQIGDQGVQYLSKALPHNRTLATLNLSSNQIKAQGAQYLNEALLRTTALRELRLAENKIGPQGAQHLSEALAHNTTLITLNLWNNEIGNAGAQHLGYALRLNKTLTRLDLSNNQIGDQGAKHLSDALRINTTLTTLDLGRNQIGDSGVQYMSGVLHENKTLTTLDLSNNPIADQGVKHLVQLKKKNKTLNIVCDKDLSRLMDSCAIS